MRQLLSQNCFFSIAAGPRLHCFLGVAIQCGLFWTTIAAVPAIAQTVCMGTPTECSVGREQLCKSEPAPANLFISHDVRVHGTLLDPAGAPLNFGKIQSDSRTILQIRDPKTGKTLFFAPLRVNGEFDFEHVPAGTYRLIAVWMKDGKPGRLPLADQPNAMSCTNAKECEINPVIRFHGTDNLIDFCPPK